MAVLGFIFIVGLGLFVTVMGLMLTYAGNAFSGSNGMTPGIVIFIIGIAVLGFAYEYSPFILVFTGALK